MKLNRIIKNLHGDESAMSFPSRSLVDALPKNPDGSPDTSKLPRETVKNVILNSLANYPVKDNKEIFFVNTIAQSIIGEEENVELKEKFNKFIVNVLYTMTVQEDEKGRQTGIYYSWVIVQVLDELGTNINLED